MRSRLGLALACAVALAGALGAQQGGQAPPTFRGGIDAVTVDAIVTDKQGKPVTDLTAADFEIIEAKKPQAIQTFKLIKIDTNQPDSSFVHDITSIDEQQRETARDDMRVIVIFLDDYHVRAGNSLVVKQQLAKFVSGLTSHDLVAVMYPLMSVRDLTFSRNHETNADIVAHFLGRKYNYTPANAYEQQYSEYPPEALEHLRQQIVITALRGLATYLGTLRDGKKQVLFVSEGITGSLPPGIHVQSQSAYRGQAPAPNDRDRLFNQMDVMSDTTQLFKQAARANVSFYPLDPRGLAVSESTMADNMSMEMDRAFLNEAQDWLKTIAENTDGRSIVNRNDPMPELKQMLADSSAYYLLGYTSTEAARDGKFHEIQVRVKRKDVEVRARKGYWAYSTEDAERATAPPKVGPSAAVEEALGTLAVSREHTVRTWVGSQRAAEGKASVTFAWEPINEHNVDVPATRRDDSEIVDRVVLTATSSGGTVVYQGSVPRDPQALTPSGHVVFDAPPGSLRLQVISENSKGQRLDRSDSAADVPDFTGADPMITTPVVYRGRTVRDINQIRAAASPVPVVNREFSRTERLLIRFQAYGPGGAAPTVTLRLLNGGGTSMAAFPAPNKLPDGTFESEIGLGSLAPGNYLIEINAEVPTGKTQSLLAIKVTS